MKGKTKIAIVAVFLLVLGASFMPDVTAKDKQRPSDVEKYMKSLKGKVISEGKKLANGNCWVNYSITGWGNPNYPYGRINITVTDDCKVIVSDVALEKTEYKRKPDKDGESEDKRLDPQPRVQEQFSIQSAVEREGWAENRYEEQFHIDVTKTSVDMDYWDDGSKVYNGHDAWVRTWWRSGTGWYKISSGGSYYPYGPNEVWVYGYGEFSNSLNPSYFWHKLHAEFDGYPGGLYSYACWFEGNQPPLWHTHCSGGIRSPT
ncbi:MAG: hypothetical protein ABH874_04565 [Methanobacteriota archaeon]